MKIDTKNKLSIMTECAVMTALAFVCSFIKIWEMPQGGSISLTMIPLFVISFRRGAWAGMISGAIYGVIAMLTAGVIYHPLSILLDYVLAFGLIGISGFFKKSFWGIAGGVTVGVLARFISSLLSGAVLFAEFAPEGQNPWIYSLTYQATYLVPEMIISLAVVLILYKKSGKLLNA